MLHFSIIHLFTVNMKIDLLYRMTVQKHIKEIDLSSPK